MNSSRPRFAAIAALFAIVAIGGSIARALAVGDDIGAARVAIGSGIAIACGLLLAMAFMTVLGPMHGLVTVSVNAARFNFDLLFARDSLVCHEQSE
jgi:CHASE2 domain-containing sensor protein